VLTCIKTDYDKVKDRINAVNTTTVYTRTHTHIYTHIHTHIHIYIHARA